MIEELEKPIKRKYCMRLLKTLHQQEGQLTDGVLRPELLYKK